jgi:MATE family multidrug resistance protein
VCNVLVRGDGFLLAMGLPRAGLVPMGALGAGLASSIACLVLVAVAAPFTRAVEREQAGDLGAPVPVTRILVLGAPMGLQLVAEIGIFATVALVAGRMGAIVTAAHQVAIGLASFTFMGVLGLSGATSVRVGHAVGEGRSARRPGFVGIGLGAIYMLACGVVFAALPAPLVRLFTADPDVIALGSDLLRVAALFQVVDGVQGVAAGALRGVGDVRQPFLANVVGHWIVGLPVAVLLGLPGRLGARGLWLGLTIGLAFVAVALVARFAAVSRTQVKRI